MALQSQLYAENLGFSLGGSQDWCMENCCGFNGLYSSNLHQQEKQQQYMQLQQQLQNLQHNSQDSYLQTSLLSKSKSINSQSMAFHPNIEAQIQKQGQEIDFFITLQNERLRLALQEQRNQQTTLLLKKCQSRTEFLFKQKDEEITKAINRTLELENILKKVEIEKQTWQRLAKENEAMVMSLNQKMEQLRKQSGFFSSNGAEDAESCCESAEQMREKICKTCNSSSLCVVFLPCRHLCSCEDCGAFLRSCAVCGMVKKASILALV